MVKGCDTAMKKFMARLISNDKRGEIMRKLVFQADELLEENICPGQFVHLKVPGATANLLRRPISIMDFNKSEGTVTLMIQPKGEGTRLICDMRPDDRVEMIAPLGHGFDIGDACIVWAMGGGVGVAPMVYACKKFSQTAEITSIMGYRTERQIFAENALSWVSNELIICTDDGSMGICGNVIDGAKTLSGKPDLIIACGPTPMLKAVQQFALENHIPCQLSLEQRMGCGYGACLTCSCKTKDADGNEDYARVCADGPVFNAAEVVL